MLTGPATVPIPLWRQAGILALLRFRYADWLAAREMNAAVVAGEFIRQMARPEPCDCGCPGEKYDGHVCEDYAA